MNLRFVLPAIVFVCGLGAMSQAEQLHLKVSPPKMDCVDVPVHAGIELAESLAEVPAGEIAVTLKQTSRDRARIYGKLMPGQLIKTGAGKAELWWIAPSLRKADGQTAWTAVVKRGEEPDKEVFSWQDNKGEYLDLLFDGRKITRYMYAYDTSNAQRGFETYKPFHHVFDAQGENLLTNGPDGMHPYLKDKILYPHHRGIFIGWSKLAFGGRTYGFWGMGGGVAQRHVKFLELTAGPVLARSKALIHWNDKNGEPIIAEERQATVFRQSDPTILLLDFRTELKAVRGEVLLNGDPEHAGFQYRAHNDVAAGDKEVKATYLFHEEDINPKEDKDLPWVAMSYGLNARRYSVLHTNHPDNPKATVYSAYRDYGRFGAFFKETINSGETLTLRYRIWVAEGQMPERQICAGKYSTFVDCPMVEALSR
ncbi:MAG: PmoA family protein [Planctomycetes bacterium]|nr:PmoA family protein [Planctomycetota bacterium]